MTGGDTHLGLNSTPPECASPRSTAYRRWCPSECFREFRSRLQEPDPTPQHLRNLRNCMLRHLARHRSGGDGLEPGIMSRLKEPLPLRVGVPDQRLPTTAQATRLLEPCGLGSCVGLPNLPRPLRSFDPFGVHLQISVSI